MWSVRIAFPVFTKKYFKLFHLYVISKVVKYLSDNSLQSQLEEQIGKLIHQNTMLQADIITKTNTLEIIVAEKSEFESKCVYLEDQCRIMLQVNSLS